MKVLHPPPPGAVPSPQLGEVKMGGLLKRVPPRPTPASPWGLLEDSREGKDSKGKRPEDEVRGTVLKERAACGVVMVR